VKQHTLTITDDNLYEALMALEKVFDIRLAVVTREDVNDEFQQMLFAAEQPGRPLTDEEWDQFTDLWFWRKGHYDVLWDGVSDSIREDLREVGVVPQWG
jgi:hypothetical protein